VGHTHKDLEFHVSAGEKTTVHDKWAFACQQADSASRGGEKAVIDIVTWSRAGAKAWAGDYGGELYDEDPEASVFERFEVRAHSVGKIP